MPPDATGRPAMSPELILLMTLRIMRSGTSLQQMVDQTGYAVSTMSLKFKTAVALICQYLGPIFLPNTPDPIQQEEILATMRERGWPGCCGSLDCTHVTWRCPKALQPLYKGKENDTTVVSMAIASPTLFCTHLFVGACGTNNDLATLKMDPLMHQILNGTYCQDVPFTICGQEFSRNYYLVDGIFPNWSIFATTLSHPSSLAAKRYCKRQESCRKDVERLFGVVKQRFKIMRTGNRIEFRDKDVLCTIVSACFIIHNAIVLENEGQYTAWMESRGHSGSPPVISDPAMNPNDDSSDDHPAVDTAPSSSLLKADIIKAMVGATRSVINEADHFRLREALIAYHSLLT